MTRKSVVLPDAVRADEAGELARPHLEGDVVEDRASREPDVDALDREDRRGDPDVRHGACSLTGARSRRLSATAFWIACTSASIQRLVVVARRRHRLVDADDRDAGVLGGLADRGRERVDDLLVVAEHLHLVLGEEAVLERDVLRRGIDAVHDVGLEAERRHVVRAHRLQQVVGDRLGRRDRGPAYFALKAAIACSHGCERRVEGVQVRLEVRARALGRSAARSAAIALATAGIVFGLYQRCGFGVLSGRPSSVWTTMTLRVEFGDADSILFMNVS